MNYRPSYPPSHRPSKPRPTNLRNFVQHVHDDESDESDYHQDAAFPSSDENNNNDNDDEDDDDYYTARHRGAAVESSSHHRNRNPKKRRVEDLSPNYEFRPRGGSHPIRAEWKEHSTSVLLDCWGERFLQLGRSSLRSEDWIEVSERVSEATGFEFGVSECRGRLNVLRNKYRKEKAKSEAVGGISMWGYYKKMDMLMTLPARQERQCGLACGVDAGEFVFMNPRVYLEHSNAMDEMRDSPGSSEEEEGEEEDEEEVEDLEAYRVLSESIKRVGEIYEKIEDSKRHHMMELESMRMEFERDLELQKKDMVERTRAEIERIRQAREKEEEEEEEEEDEEDGDRSPETTG